MTIISIQRSTERHIHQEIDYYRNHLNTVLKFDYKELTRDACVHYFKKIVGRTIRKMTSNTELAAIVAVFGEVIRRERKGKWLLVKWYGYYNPYYRPCILTPDDNAIHISNYVMSALKWKSTASAQQIFDSERSLIPVKFVSDHHECMILE